MALRIDVPIGKHLKFINTSIAGKDKIHLQEGTNSTYAVINDPELIDWAKHNLTSIAVLTET